MIRHTLASLLIASWILVIRQPTPCGLALIPNPNGSGFIITHWCYNGAWPR